MLKPAAARGTDQEPGNGKRSPRGENRTGLFFDARSSRSIPIMFRIPEATNEAGCNVVDVKNDLRDFSVDQLRYISHVEINAR